MRASKSTDCNMTILGGGEVAAGFFGQNFEQVDGGARAHDVDWWPLALLRAWLPICSMAVR